MESFEQHIPETQPTSEVLETRLELEYRNPLQVCILRRQSLGENVVDSNDAFERILHNLDRISAVIDANTPEGEEIRELARAQKYEEATTKIIVLLDLKKVEPSRT